MLKSGDSSLNQFFQHLGESAMGSLKQAILEQELTFRIQVRELHSLYWTQKNMMKELRQKSVLFRNHQRNINLQLPVDDFISIELNDSNNDSVLETDVSNANGKFDVEKSSLYFEIIDLEESHEKGIVSLKENDACCVPFMAHFGEGQDRRLEELMPHDSCVGLDDSSLDTVNDHSRISHESRTILFGLNIPVRDSEVYNSSQDSLLADSNTKKFNDIESKLDMNVLPSAYPVEGSTGSTDGVLISINETSISEKEVSLSEKRLVVALSDKEWQNSKITSRDSTEKLSNHEESEEDTLSTHSTDEDEDQQNSNNMSECCSYEKGSREATALSITDDSVITQSHSTENEMSEEHDAATTEAAHTLMAISFIEISREDNIDEFQVSSDSFEAMTMHLSEVQTDEIMHDIPRLNVREKDEMMVRPKRGKRLRNFQKEILPGIVSLSRHEICEDLYSINYEFKRNTVRTTGNLFAPVTSRRLRLYSGRRRRFRSFPC